MKRWVDLIDDTNSRYPLPYPESRKILGCLGADLRRMSTLGAPVPLGFTVTTEAWIEYRDNGETFPEDFLDQVVDAITILGMKSEKSFGDPTKPLLLIWNTSIPIHSPGMIGPIKYIGLNDDTADGLAGLTNNPHEVFYDYCEFITNFCSEIYGIETGKFEDYLSKYMKSKGYQYQPDIPASEWRSIADSYKGIFKNSTGLDFPQGPYEQLWLAIDTGFRKWIEWAESEQGNPDGVTHDAGLAHTFRVAVFGKMPRSGIGYAVTRNPETGSKEILGGYIKDSELPNWITQPQDYTGLDELKKEFPVAYKELIGACEIIEKYYRDMVRLTFVIEKEILWVVNSTVAERSPNAAVKIAVDFLDEGLIIKPEVVPMVSPGQLKFLYLPQFPSDSQAKPIAEGRESFPGAGSGILAFTAKEVIELVGEGKKVIFITPGHVEESSVLFDNRRNISGIIASGDRELSDAARIAETLVVPCVSVPNMEIGPDKKTATMPDGYAFSSGDSVTINGTTGAIYLGELPLVYTKPHEDRYLSRFESIISGIEPKTLFSETVSSFEELKEIITINTKNIGKGADTTKLDTAQTPEEIAIQEQEIADLISGIREIKSELIDGDSNLLSRCIQYKDPRVVTSLLARYHGLGNKRSNAAHFIRNTIKKIEGPSFRTLWQHIDGTYGADLDSTENEERFSRDAAGDILQMVGGAPALEKAINRLNRTFARPELKASPLLGKLIVGIADRYREIIDHDETTTFAPDKPTEGPENKIRKDSEPHDRQMQMRNEDNEYFIPVEQQVLRIFQENLPRFPEDIFPLGIRELKNRLRLIPVKDKTETTTIADKTGMPVVGVTRFPDGRHLFHAYKKGDVQAVVMQAFLISASIISKDDQELFSRWAGMSELEWTQEHREAFAMVLYNHLLEVKNQGGVLPPKMQGAMEALLKEGVVPKLIIEISPELKQLFNDMFSA